MTVPVDISVMDVMVVFTDEQYAVHELDTADTRLDVRVARVDAVIFPLEKAVSGRDESVSNVVDETRISVFDADAEALVVAEGVDDGEPATENCAPTAPALKVLVSLNASSAFTLVS